MWWCFRTQPRKYLEIVKLAARYEVPVVGRGAGTGLSGGALARGGGVMIVFARMNKILEIDVENRRAVVQPGVVNLDITRAVEHAGLVFCAGSFEREVVHHRRKCGGERRRAAHAGLRSDNQSHCGAGIGDAGWRDCASGEQARRCTRDMTFAGCL